MNITVFSIIWHNQIDGILHDRLLALWQISEFPTGCYCLVSIAHQTIKHWCHGIIMPVGWAVREAKWTDNKNIILNGMFHFKPILQHILSTKTYSEYTSSKTISVFETA